MSKIVAIHDAVGTFTRGDVIDTAKLPVGASVDRLLRIGACREAMASEEHLEKVTFPDSDEKSKLPLEEEIIRLRAQNADLRGQVKELEQDLVAVRTTLPPKGRDLQGDEQVQKLLAEKDQVIQDLNAKINELEGRIARQKK